MLCVFVYVYENWMIRDTGIRIVHITLWKWK